MVFWSNDLEWAGLGYGLLLGTVGGVFSCIGLCTWRSILATTQNADRLLSIAGKDAAARVTSKETKLISGGELDKARPGAFRAYYLVSYVFDAVRSDGMTCRIEIRERKVPSFVWKMMKVGELVKVRYLHDEPRVCRVTAAAEHEKRGMCAMKLRALVGCIFFWLGLVATTLSVADHHIAGLIAWISIVGVHSVWLTGGRKMCRQLCECFAFDLLQEAWSPLFVHSGYVFFSEIGKDVEPSSEPTSLVPQNVGLLVDVPDGRVEQRQRKPDRTWTQNYESECRNGGVV